ncbi:MAG: hypothetical protein ACLFS5_06195 [Spirochaetaceae bacterium]
MFTAVTIEGVTGASRGRLRKGTEVLVDRPPSGRFELQDAVLYPGGRTVEVRRVEEASAGRLRLLLRGATRKDLGDAGFLLGPEAEMCVAPFAVCRGEVRAGTYVLSELPRPAGGRSAASWEGGATVRTAPVRVRVELTTDAVMLRAERAVPFLPAHRYHFEDGGSVTVLAAGPRPEVAALDRTASLVRYADPGDPGSLERLSLGLYGITPRLGGVTDGVRFEHYLVSEEWMQESTEELAEVLRETPEIPPAAVYESVRELWGYLPQTLRRELIDVLCARLGLIREEGRIRAADGGPPEAVAPAGTPRSGSSPHTAPEASRGLSPAERSILRTVQRAGRGGEHVKSPRLERARELVHRLAEQGLLVELPNGRVFSRAAYAELAGALFDAGEVDDRRAATVWGVSRNTGRELLNRMICDGLVHRTSPRTVVAVEGELRE